MRGVATLAVWVGIVSMLTAQPAGAQLNITVPQAPASLAPDPGEVQTLNQQLKESQDRLQAYEAENAALRRRNDLSNETIRTLNESLAVSNAEGEVFKRQYSDLKLRMEALGLASVGDNKEALEQRLLASVRDLSLVRDAKDKLVERMMALIESVVLYIKAAPAADPQIRLDIEAQMRAANGAMDASAAEEAAANLPPQADLNNGQVVSVKEEYSLIVANLGSQQGVKIGMPFQVIRGNHLVGRARVVDVRERISGAVMEDYGSTTEKVKVGDGLRVDAQS